MPNAIVEAPNALPISITSSLSQSPFQVPLGVQTGGVVNTYNLGVPTSSGYVPTYVQIGTPNNSGSTSLVPPTSNGQCQINAPGRNRLNGVPFTVRAAGYISMPGQTVTTSAAPVTFGLYGANTAAFSAAAGNLLGSTVMPQFTCSAQGLTGCYFLLEASLYGVTGGILGGAIQGWNADVNGRTTVLNRTAVGTIISSNLNWETNASPAEADASFNNALASPPVQFAAAISTAASVNLVGTFVLTSLVLEA
jgi:hypothetical protein